MKRGHATSAALSARRRRCGALLARLQLPGQVPRTSSPTLLGSCRAPTLPPAVPMSAVTVPAHEEPSGAPAAPDRPNAKFHVLARPWPGWTTSARTCKEKVKLTSAALSRNLEGSGLPPRALAVSGLGLPSLLHALHQDRYPLHVTTYDSGRPVLGRRDGPSPYGDRPLATGRLPNQRNQRGQFW